MLFSEFDEVLRLLGKVLGSVGKRVSRMNNAFIGQVSLFQREKGWYYIPVPVELSKPLEYLADRGLIAITAKVGASSWSTSMLPMGDGTHFIPLPAKIRKKESITLGKTVELSFELRRM